MQIKEKHPTPFHDRSNVIGKSHCCRLGRARPILPAQPHPMTQAPIHYAPHETRPSGARSCQQPASVESESNHLMLNLIALISPCLQLLYPELKVHASCLFWVPWVIRKSFGTARVGPSWWSAVPWRRSRAERDIWCALSPAGITQFKHSLVYWGFLWYTIENHSGKLEVLSLLRLLNYSIKQY